MGLSRQNAGLVADDRPAPMPYDQLRLTEPSVMVTAVAHCYEQVRHDDSQRVQGGVGARRRRPRRV